MKNKLKFKKLIIVSGVVLGTVLGGISIAVKKKKGASIYEGEPEQKNPMEGKKVVFVEDESDKENADGVRGHLEAVGDSNHVPSVYEKYVKRGIDIILSFGGLVALSPIMGIIALAIKAEDPGPVLFTQKRLGQNKKYFKLHKFRSMKMETPHDVPTHMLDNPDQYITKVGKFIRAHSLDELPQIWDIFVGNMSVIGPRPGLWNQDLLTAERDKYGANDIKPGLTGWAQINGRDEIEIPEKAKLDGEYAQNMGLTTDAKVFLGSLRVFGGDDSVVEGGTGIKNSNKIKDLQDFNTNPVKKKRILITGANSYIGDSVHDYLVNTDPDMYEIDILDTKCSEIKLEDFISYDVVFNVAGVAHIKETNKNRQIYYDVNRDLVIRIAKTAKEAGVRQFVMLSSMSVYGKTVGYITKDSIPKPVNAYGDSKMQADETIVKLSDENFIVSVLRPPMVYGNGCKGNYQMLRKFALKSPVFPKYKNQRSMIYIGNLCEFVKRVIDLEEDGIFFPQNANYVNTFEMVHLIATNNGKKIKEISFLNLVIKLMRVEIVNKVFGNLIYENVDTVSKFGFEESIFITENGVNK